MTNLPVAIENINLENAPSIYKQGGLNPFIAHIKEQVTGEVPDLSTKKGRDRIASLAAQVSRSKTAIEKPGRDYLKHLKELPKTVEAELREFVKSCDELRDELRQPLTDWENAEKEREAKHNANIAWFGETAQLGLTAAEIKHNLEAVTGSKINEIECEEFFSNYIKAKEAAIELLTQRYDFQLKQEQQQAELEELRRKQAEQERIERERMIAEQAAANAKLAAEQEARLQREAAEKLERDRQLEFERKEMQLKLQAEQAERQKLEAEQRAEQEKANAEARAKQAVEDERKRYEAEQAAIKAEQERISANKEHRVNVNREILTALIALGIDEQVAKQVITASAKGLTAKMVINY